MHHDPFIRLLQCAALGAILSTSLQAAVILNDAVVADRPLQGVPDGFQYLRLTTSTLSGGLVENRITNLGGGSFRFDYFGIAEHYAFFQVVGGTSFNPAYVLANTPFFANNAMPGFGTLTLSEGNSVLLAYWDDRMPPLNAGVETSDNFGWVRLTRTASGLVASESATAIGGGIIVGTTIQIPEPSSGMLILGSLSAALLGIRVRPRVSGSV